MSESHGLEARMIVVRFQKTFPLRVSEWLMAGIVLTWGVVLLANPTVFDAPHHSSMREMADQQTWGVMCLGMGLTRWAVLTINGAWRASPHIRAACAFSTCFFWLLISYGLAGSGVVTTGLAVYPWFLLLDIYNVFRAASDAREADDRAKAGLSLH